MFGKTSRILTYAAAHRRKRKATKMMGNCDLRKVLPNGYAHSIWGRNETQFKEAARSDFIAAWDNDLTPSCDWP